MTYILGSSFLKCSMVYQSLSVMLMHQLLPLSVHLRNLQDTLVLFQFTIVPGIGILILQNKKRSRECLIFVKKIH